MGVPALAYLIAKERGWKTGGVACSKAILPDDKGKKRPTFKTDWVQIFGEKWGDDSEFFLNNVDVLVRVGGEEQSEQEMKTWKAMAGLRPVFEEDFEPLPPGSEGSALRKEEAGLVTIPESVINILGVLA